jgi:hypothetical protein
MKTLRLLTFLLLASVLAMAADVQAYTIRLQAGPDDTGKALGTLALANCTPGTLVLPLGFSTVEDLRLEEPAAGVRLESSPRNGMTQLKFTLPGDIPAKTSLKFSFRLKQVFQITKLKPGEKSTLPASSRSFKHAFVNTQEGVIGSYRMEFIFPDGLMAQAIREQLPKPAKNEVGPRVSLSKVEGHQAAILQFNKLQQGDDTSMIVELVPTRRSFGWLIAGLLLGGLYLVKFKDLIAKKPS